MKKKIAIILLLAAIFFQPILLIYKNQYYFFSPNYQNRYSLLKSLYYSSQYVKKNNPSIIPDQELEAFAAGAFVKGLNPILIVHDQPPMGRYIEGLFIVLFNNVEISVLFALFLSIVGLFFVAREVFHDSFWALIPIVIFVNEPLFLDKINYAPLLEPIQLPFIIFSLWFFIKGVTGKNQLKWFLFTSLMLGFVISIRFFVVGGALLGAMVVFILLLKDFKSFTRFFLTLPLTLILLIFSYTQTLKFGYSVIDVFKIQKYIFYYHKSKFILPFSFWDLLLFNRWHTWWGDRRILSDSDWIILWPIFFILTATFVILTFTKKLKMGNAEKIILLWITFYCLLLSIGYTSTRYFLPLTPFLYIIGIAVIKYLVVRRKKISD